VSRLTQHVTQAQRGLLPVNELTSVISVLSAGYCRRRRWQLNWCMRLVVYEARFRWIRNSISLRSGRIAAVVRIANWKKNLSSFAAYSSRRWIG